MVLDEVDNLRELVDAASAGGLPAAPLMAVHGAQVAVLVGPFVPDAHTVVVQVLDVGIPRNEPEEFVDNGTEVHFLGGQQGKALAEVEAHLVAEYALGAYAGAVALDDAVLADVPK